MRQTPIHEVHNDELLKLIPVSVRKIVEVGCSSGALAREYKKINASCEYIGIEIDSDYGQLADQYCDSVIIGDCELFDNDFFQRHSDADCWIFADVLEHLKDPWRILRSINTVLCKDGIVVACIPNIQHWSVQSRISTGDFRYQDIGMLDRTHLRWFTRKTIIEMFEEAGFAIQDMWFRIITKDPREDEFLQKIALLASLAGSSPDEAKRDALPNQYIVVASPRKS